MPGLDRYDTRHEAYVQPHYSLEIQYGFLTNVDINKFATLGHVAVDRDNLPPAIVFGANRPKPGRATKKVVDGTISSFYDFSQYATLRETGWSLSLPRIRRAKTTQFTEARYVLIDGIKYAWMMPVTTIAKVGGDAAGLGIQTPSQGDEDLVWGASYPKPRRVQKRVQTLGDIDTISTFCDPSKVDSLPAGWEAVGSEELS